MNFEGQSYCLLMWWREPIQGIKAAICALHNLMVRVMAFCGCGSLW